MTLSAVVLPAPFGPMSPRMRPSSTRILMPSSATVWSKDLRRPRASMQAMGLAALLGWFVLWNVARLLLSRVGLEQLFWFEAKALNGGVDARPFFVEKFLTLAL